MRLMLLALSAALCLIAVSTTASSVPPIYLKAASPSTGRVQLQWANGVAGAADTPTLDVSRDGVFDASVANPQPFTVNSATLTGEPSGNHVYQVCEHIVQLTVGWTDDLPVLCSNQEPVTVR